MLKQNKRKYDEVSSDEEAMEEGREWNQEPSVELDEDLLDIEAPKL